MEPVTTNNLATINGNMLVAVGFDTEVLQSNKKDGNIKDVLVTYDSYCSHTMMSSVLARATGTITTHSFMGNS